MQAAEPFAVETPQLACKLAASVSETPALLLNTATNGFEATTPAPMVVTVHASPSSPEVPTLDTVKCELSPQQHSALVTVASELGHSQQFHLATCPEPLVHMGTPGFDDEVPLGLVAEGRRELAIDRHSVQVGDGIQGDRDIHITITTGSKHPCHCS